MGGYPHSVAFRPGEILIAKTDGFYVAPYQLGQATISPNVVKLLAALPGGGGHSSRTVAVVYTTERARWSAWCLGLGPRR